MKLIKCIIPEEKLDAVKQALLDKGIQGMTIYDVRGFGIHRSQLKNKVNPNYRVDIQHRIMLEIVLPDEQTGKTIQQLKTTVGTGRLGDGKLFVLPVEETVRLRTGETGEAAL
jgi:nitrogen regulatory protein P-II 1